MGKLFGEIKTLKASQKNDLEKIANKRLSPNLIISAELLQKAANLSTKLNSHLGLLIGRDGRVKYAGVGTKNRIYLPDLGRFGLDSARLRRLRFFVAIPCSKKDIRNLSIPTDLITDLEKLRFDALVVAYVGEDASPLRIDFAYLKPQSGFDSRTEVVVEEYSRVSEIKVKFREFISDLEKQIVSIRPKTFDTKKDHAVLVGVYTGKPKEAEVSMVELQELARTAGIEILDSFIQRRRAVDPKTVIGKGRLEELMLDCLDLGADFVIFDRELSPGQLRSIANISELKVIDRSMLILDIFAQRAVSSEGRLQVELAQLKYSLPRLTETDSGLSRLTGGIGGRGPGETKLEISRRRARKRIADLEKRIDKISKQRELRRGRRQSRGVPVIAIVGYTNAGKSTLLNALTKGDVLVESKLFATLDPSSRRMRFPNEKEVIFVDTVGFIRELPKELVNAFRATLEEVEEADILLHVVDASDSDLNKKIEVVNATLASIGAGNKPQILVLNKSDLLSTIEVKTLERRTGGLSVSAVKRTGFKRVIKLLQEGLVQSFEGRDPGRFLGLD